DSGRVLGVAIQLELDFLLDRGVAQNAAHRLKVLQLHQEDTFGITAGSPDTWMPTVDWTAEFCWKLNGKEFMNPSNTIHERSSSTPQPYSPAEAVVVAGSSVPSENPTAH